MSILLKSISDSDTVLMVSDSATLPQDNGVIQIESEILTYTTIYMNTLYGCTRGIRSTSATSHLEGSTILFVDSFTPASGGGGSGTVSPGTAGQFAVYSDTTTVESSSHLTLAGGGDHGLTTTSDFAIGTGSILAFGDVDGPDAYFTFGLTPNTFSLIVGSPYYIRANNVDQTLILGPGATVQFDLNGAAGETSMLLYDVTADTLQRVSIGAADSGGTGFRVLRIPN